MFAQVTVEGSANTFGDAQLSVDVIADEIMWEVAKGSEVVAYGASEEEPEIVKCNPKGEYTICWDPLDGSSIVDNNWAVGTIIGVFVRGVLLSCGAGVWRLASGRVATPFRRLTPLRHRREAGHDVAPASGRRRRGTPETPPPTRESHIERREHETNRDRNKKHARRWGSKSGKGDDGLLGATGRDQVTSLVALYGPRTTVAVALDDGVYEFSYGCTPEGCMLEDGTYEPWICSRAKIEVAKDCRIFSPANLRAAKEVAGYKRLVEHYMDDKYTLRYSGGLVPDIYQQFTKNQGVFANPTSDSSPAKLRLAFEAAPFGLLVEKAGGKTSDGVTGGSILDVEITAVDQRTALCIGSANEVDRFNEYLECDDDGCNTSK